MGLRRVLTLLAWLPPGSAVYRAYEAANAEPEPAPAAPPRRVATSDEVLDFFSKRKAVKT